MASCVCSAPKKYGRQLRMAYGTLEVIEALGPPQKRVNVSVTVKWFYIIPTGGQKVNTHTHTHPRPPFLTLLVDSFAG